MGDEVNTPGVPPTPTTGTQKITAWAAAASASLGVVSAFFAFFAQQGTTELAKQLTQQDIKLKDVQAVVASNAESRADRESYTKLDQFVYSEIVKLFELPDTTSKEVRAKREMVVTALVMTMTTEKVRTLFSNALASQIQSPTLKIEVTKAAEYFQIEDDLLRVRPATSAPPGMDAKGQSPAKSSLAEYRIDAFYCEQDPAAETYKKYAENLVSEFNKRGFVGKWRIRSLPEKVNTLAGYGIATPQIRFNPLDGETVPAQDLKTMVEKDFALINKVPAAFNLQQVGQRTPNYISIFLCGLK